MKAESIEQIREHLARAGRVNAVLRDGTTEQVKRVDMGFLRVYAGSWSSSFGCRDVDHWELVPIEEEKKEDISKLPRSMPMPSRDPEVMQLSDVYAAFEGDQEAQKRIDGAFERQEKKVVCLPIETAKSCLACLDFMIDDFMTRQYAGLDYKTLADARDQLRRAVEAEE